MFNVAITCVNVLLAALLVGGMFGVWLVLNPRGLDARSYVAVHQQAVRGLNRTMPILGAATILFTIAAAFLVRADRWRVGFLLTAMICFVAAGLVTRFLNQPINAIVMTWDGAAPPSSWVNLRDAWWRWHVVRLAAGFGGLCLLLAATLRGAGVE